MSFFDDKCLPGLHLILATTLSGYAFILKKNNFDFIYLFCTYLILIHWTFLNGECAISYYFKKQKDKNYVAGKDLHKDEYSILLKDYVNIIKFFLVAINILLVISVYITFKRNNIPSYISITFLSIFEIYFYGLYFFSNHYKNENFFIFQNVIRFLIILNGIFTFIHFSKNFTV
jgi:hypothetical protein